MLVEVDELSGAGDAHFLSSVLRERIVEHVFVGEMLRRLWQLGITDVEVLRSEFDAGGYDLVVGFGKILRHIQFKSSRRASATGEVTLSLRLADKPSGCVVWVMVDDNLGFDHFLWFGGTPGEPLPGIKQLPTAKNVRANSLGVKTERPNHRRIGKKHFTKLDALDDVLERLFGVVSPGTVAKPVA